jgi:hypothetical protein
MRAIVQGQNVPDYAKVQGIFLGVVAAYLIAVTIFGPECVSYRLLFLHYLTCSTQASWLRVREAQDGN